MTWLELFYGCAFVWCVGGSWWVWWWLRTNPVPPLMPVFEYQTYRRRSEPRIAATASSCASYIQVVRNGYSLTSQPNYGPGATWKVNRPDDIQWFAAHE